MDQQALTERIYREFLELPGLRLSLPQAARLIDAPIDVCRAILESLVGSHFLVWQTDGVIVRAPR